MERQDIVSVFRKPYLLFIALIVVIYGCIILIFATYAVNQRQEENENARAAVKRSADNLSEQLGIVAELERSLVSDSRMTAIRQNDFPNEYERSVQILELLRNIKSFRSMKIFLFCSPVRNWRSARRTIWFGQSVYPEFAQKEILHAVCSGLEDRCIWNYGIP